MANEKELRQAKYVYETMCQCLDNKGWTYDRNDEELSIVTGARGEDIPIDLHLMVDADRSIVSFLSKLPFHVEKDQLITMSAAISFVNYMLVDGNFDYNIANGNMMFRMTSSYLNSLLGEDVIDYMIYLTCKTVDTYNDAFVLLSCGKMTLETFMKSFSNNN